MLSSGSAAGSTGFSWVAIRPICHDWAPDRNPGLRQRILVAAVWRELRVDDRSRRKLARPGAAARHAGARSHQAEVAAHEAARSLQVGEDLSAIVGDGVDRRTPRAPAAPAPAPVPAAEAAAPAPAGAPAAPKRVIIGHAFGGDLEERTLEHFAVAELGNHISAGAATFGPRERGADVLADNLPGPDAGGRAGRGREDNQ